MTPEKLNQVRLELADGDSPSRATCQAMLACIDALDDATPLSEAARVMQKRIGSTPFPEGLQAIADDAHVLIARQAFRIAQLEKVAMRPIQGDRQCVDR